MTRIRQIFNPSTLKAHYNADTNKAMVVDLDKKLPGVVCEYCDEDATPAYVTVTFSGLTDCSCYTTSGEIFIGVADTINDIKFRLPSGGSCTWSEAFVGSWGVMRDYVGADCTGDYDEYSLTNFLISVSKMDDTQILVDTQVNDGAGHAGRPFYFFGVPTSLDNCIEAVCNNENDCTLPGLDSCSGGTATIQEGQW